METGSFRAGSRGRLEGPSTDMRPHCALLPDRRLY